jgi:hypothetical protein
MNYGIEGNIEYKSLRMMSTLMMHDASRGCKNNGINWLPGSKS